MWTRIAAAGLWRSATRSKSAKDMQRSSRLQSTNSTSAPALTAASGVAMKVFDGQSTVSPRTPANSSAASAPPAQLESPRLGSPFHSRQRASNASSIGPSDHCSESSTSVQSSTSLARSRWSNPIANFAGSETGAVEVKAAARLPLPTGLKAAYMLTFRPVGGGVGAGDHGADRARAGQQHGAGDGEGHRGDEDGAPQRGVAPGLAEDQRREQNRDQDLDREHRRRHVRRRAALERAHLAEQGQPLRGGDRGEPGDRDEKGARGQLVGE